MTDTITTRRHALPEAAEGWMLWTAVFGYERDLWPTEDEAKRARDALESRKYMAYRNVAINVVPVTITPSN